MGCGGSKELTEASAKKRAESPNADLVRESMSVNGPLTQNELQARVIGMEKEEVAALGPKSGFTLRYAALSQRGYDPEEPYLPNQDRYVILPRYNSKADQMLLGVLDGHGHDGDAAAEFVKQNLGPELAKKMSSDKYKYDFRRAYQQTFVAIDEHMAHDAKFDANYSGCTAITAFFRGGEMTVANIGDSRAVLGERRGRRVVAYSLSVDHTCFRKDELERVKTCGAHVMTMAMAKGEQKYAPGWEASIVSLEGTDDPPRVFVPDKLYPGHVFTRSLGDSLSAHVGLNAEPELLQKQLGEQDQFIVLASHGVWEYLTNQSVCQTVRPVDRAVRRGSSSKTSTRAGLRSSTRRFSPRRPTR